MKEIRLSQGKYAIVDDRDYDELSQWKWKYSNGYAVRSVYQNGKQRTISMHRMVANTPSGKDTDHISGNTLDNRRENLRVCSHAENQRNRKMSKNNKSGYKGVVWAKHTMRWKTQIMVENKPKHIGYFNNIIDAAIAYNLAALCVYGQYARLNQIPIAA